MRFLTFGVVEILKPKLFTLALVSFSTPEKH